MHKNSKGRTGVPYNSPGDFICCSAEGGKLIRSVVDYALSPDQSNPSKDICIAQVSGFWKNSFVRKVFEILSNENVLLLDNISFNSNYYVEPENVLIRWIKELSSFPGMRTGIYEKYITDDPYRIFISLLKLTSSEKRIVILLDNLDDPENDYRMTSLNWLPDVLPSNVRLILISESQNQVVARRSLSGTVKIAEFEIKESELSQIISFLAGKYFPSPVKDVLEEITDRRGDDRRRCATSPLWLMLALNEISGPLSGSLIQSEQDKIPAPGQDYGIILINRVRKLPENVNDLLNLVLKENEDIFGRTFIQALIHLYAMNPAGWRIKSLEKILPAVTGEPSDKLSLVLFRKRFFFLFSKGNQSGKLKLSGKGVYNALMEVSIKDKCTKERISGKLIQYLLHLPPGNHGRHKIMHFLLQEGIGKNLALYYSSEIVDRELKAASQALAGYVCTFDRRPHYEKKIRIEQVLSILSYKNRNLVRLIERLQFDLYECLEPMLIENGKKHYNSVLRTYLVAISESNPYNADWQRSLAVSCEKLGDISLRMKYFKEAQKEYSHCRDILNKLAVAAPDEIKWKSNLWIILIKLGDLYMVMNLSKQAAIEFYKGLSIAKELVCWESDNHEYREFLWISYDKVGTAEEKIGNLPESGEVFRIGLEIARKFSGKITGRSVWEFYKAVSLSRNGELLIKQGKPARAVAMYRKSINLMKHLYRRNPVDVRILKELVSAFDALDRIYSDNLSIKETHNLYAESLDVRKVAEILCAEDQ